jgi:RNA polymerase sigma factor (sigma-70 family)
MRQRDDEFDIELLLRAQKGDEAAFAELYRRHARAVLKYAWTRAREQQLAEDLAQETFLVAWRKRGQTSIVDESLLPWLLTIARNHANNAIRKRAREGADILPDVPATERAVEESAWLGVELRNLSSTDQILCQLCLVQGMTYREAADIVEMSASAVGKRLERARTRLRLALGHEK